MAGTHLTWLEAPEIATTVRPGQFVMVYCGEKTLLRRPLSAHQGLFLAEVWLIRSDFQRG